ncbi:hypothetical protein ACIQYO_17145 [Methylobacterium sp. NPDC097178]
MADPYLVKMGFAALRLVPDPETKKPHPVGCGSGRRASREA